MSSINPHFTFHYSQPEDYRFSHDSVFLARRVFEDIKSGKTTQYSHILDLCSGCGIIGLDLLFHLYNEGFEAPVTCDFLEVQQLYREHFDKNEALLNQSFSTIHRSDFLNFNYADLVTTPEYNEKYNLIVCNPPYFRKEHGVLSASEFKNRCRFFIDSDFKNLILGLEYTLKLNGIAYILIRSQKEHGVDVEADFRSLNTGLILEKQSPIRGTEVYRLQKIS